MQSKMAQEIAELEELKQGWVNGCDNCKEDCKEFAMDDLDKAMKIINRLKEGVKEINDCTFNEDGLCGVCREQIKDILEEND